MLFLIVGGVMQFMGFGDFPHTFVIKKWTAIFGDKIK